MTPVTDLGRGSGPATVVRGPAGEGPVRAVPSRARGWAAPRVGPGSLAELGTPLSPPAHGRVTLFLSQWAVACT